jgi:hypothetical protein
MSVIAILIKKRLNKKQVGDANKRIINKVGKDRRVLFTNLLLKKYMMN